MAQIISTEPAIADLEAIADFIAIEDPVAAAGLVRRVLRHVEQLADHPKSGSRPRELGRSRYRQVVEPPCRVFYRTAKGAVYVLHVTRTERQIDIGRLKARSKRQR
ncbi:MAG TPA: type II toxin-antitoxin system RelE/ParE family toxin [Rhodanobacteraceae bacterium]